MATIDPYDDPYEPEGQAVRRLAASRAYQGPKRDRPGLYRRSPWLDVAVWAIVGVALVLAAIGAATVIGWVVKALA